MYRPSSSSARQSDPWAMVFVKDNPDPRLGEDAEAIRQHRAPPTYTLFTMAGWPVAMREAPLGDELVALKGSVCVTVLVKNGDHGEVGRALAEVLMQKILPQIPCG